MLKNHSVEVTLVLCECKFETVDWAVCQTSHVFRRVIESCDIVNICKAIWQESVVHA